jgi:hypothetical protein
MTKRTGAAVVAIGLWVAIIAVGVTLSRTTREIQGPDCQMVRFVDSSKMPDGVIRPDPSVNYSMRIVAPSPCKK